MLTNVGAWRILAIGGWRYAIEGECLASGSWALRPEKPLAPQLLDET